MTKNYWKSSYICVFMLSKIRRNWFHKNLHNLGMAERRKLSDPSLNHIFNALSIGVQYTVSFQLTNFDLKCLLRSHIFYFLLHYNYAIYLFDVVTFFDDVRNTFYFGTFELRMEITLQLRFVFVRHCNVFSITSQLRYLFVRCSYVFCWR